jgi:Flp pilus assembly protein TadB
VSKERARRRAEREREAAVLAAARAAEAERRERRDARVRAVTSRLPRQMTRRRSRPTGVLAERRRRQTGATIALLLALNVLVWIFFGEWAIRLAAIVVSLLAAPVLHTMLFRRS